MVFSSMLFLLSENGLNYLSNKHSMAGNRLEVETTPVVVPGFNEITTGSFYHAGIL